MNIRDISVARLREYGALMGKGGEFQPVGITENKGVLTIDATKLDTDYASSAGVLTAMFPSYMVAAVLKNNVLVGSLGFTFNTSVEQYFKNLRDNVGGFRMSRLSPAPAGRSSTAPAFCPLWSPCPPWLRAT